MTTDSISRFRAASEDGDLDGVMATLSPDISVVSPLSGRMVFRGTADVRHLLGVVYSTVRDLRWREELGEGDTRVLIGTFTIGPFRGGDVSAFDLAPDGRIACMRPHLRPWLAITLFALLLGPRVARRPGVVLRALRG